MWFMQKVTLPPMNGYAAFQLLSGSLVWWKWFLIQLVIIRIFFINLLNLGVFFYQAFELIGFICVECIDGKPGYASFYCTVALFAFVFTGIFLAIELYWPNSGAQRAIDMHDIDLHLSAIGALIFMLISTLLTRNSSHLYTAGAVSLLNDITSTTYSSSLLPPTTSTFYFDFILSWQVFGYFTMVGCCVNAFWKFKKPTRNVSHPTSNNNSQQYGA